MLFGEMFLLGTVGWCWCFIPNRWDGFNAPSFQGQFLYMGGSVRENSHHCPTDEKRKDPSESILHVCTQYEESANILLIVGSYP